MNPFRSVILSFAVLLIMFIIMIPIIIGGLLEHKWSNPYLLQEASERKKWGLAVIISVLYTYFLPLFGMALLIFDLIGGKLSAVTLQVWGLWGIGFPILILGEKWKLGHLSGHYRRLDRTIKGENNPMQRIALFKWLLKRMPRETKQFLEEGYSEKDISNTEGK